MSYHVAEMRTGWRDGERIKKHRPDACARAVREIRVINPTFNLYLHPKQ